MAGPKHEYGEEVYDIGFVVPKKVMIFEVLENFGGFGKHYYMTEDGLKAEFWLNKEEKNASGDCGPPSAGH